MKKTLYLRVLADTFKRDRGMIIIYFGSALLSAAVFSLYGVVLEPFLYALTLLTVLLTALFAVDYVREFKSAKRLKEAETAFSLNAFSDTPEPEGFAEERYCAIISGLKNELMRRGDEYAADKEGMADYFTAWVHQIKTPIAVLKLKLGENDGETAAELFRIEQYADMALQYIRVGSPSSDLVIKEYSLDPIVREAVRKFAPQFIYKKLKIDYETTTARVITDKKWLSCILDQLLSNAVKYTESGSVRITFDNGRLTVSDTGVGISAEDLPRIFEKGYTGVNGRSGKLSTGLGLYLARKAAELLSLKIEAKSAPGKGSAISIVFPEESVSR